MSGRLLRLAWRNLWRNPRRTLIAMAAIGFGYTMLLFVACLMAGLRQQMIESGTGLILSDVEVHAPDYYPDRPALQTLGGRNGTEVSALVAAIAVAHFAVTWSLYVLLSWLPSYFRDIQHLSIANAGLYSAAPWLCMFAASNLALETPAYCAGARVRARLGDTAFVRATILIDMLAAMSDATDSVAIARPPIRFQEKARIMKTRSWIVNETEYSDPRKGTAAAAMTAPTKPAAPVWPRRKSG